MSIYNKYAPTHCGSRGANQTLGLTYQTSVNFQLEHIHCSAGEYLFRDLYIYHEDRMFIDPWILDEEIYQIRLALLRKNGCNDKFFFPSANFFMAALRRAHVYTDEAFATSVFENAKYIDWLQRDDPDDMSLSERFDNWRVRNNRWQMDTELEDC
jgi:hypothetical protein